ncbi:tRNA uridine-5-carboxymethylaminomethyl(34) synthesis GTPase MnmE [Dubosiella newyorkensis]|uniref:tRNA uridine-5-carboxymethylaminomethyl(34) synthesis GTPase MnmE n=1 Tax=Dubosiella newyorkensis TaxID=1862672 RepID=UPI00272FF385|nr:tRNA uridine-5-carboxymethylaminomethyl(34) synthesis GTPase MnmE [Dubosiella newyorkensis]
MFSDTIAAISTPLQEGAISIIRISGEDALPIVNSIFSKDLSQKESHTITYGYIYDNDTLVDEVLVSVFRAPKTYTREDVVEINAHGGVFITRKILGLLLQRGARLARPGEFTQRAFYHGRIDLAQAEAVEELIEANSDASAQLAIEGVRGSIRALLEPLIDDLMDIIATIEVNIDYPEYEDVEELTFSKLLPKTNAWLEKIDQILVRAKSGQVAKNGIDTVILGQPNVGKSSLLNALLDEEKAIVTDIAGTTRDIVEGQIQVKGVRLNLIDTAGIREAKDTIEKIGIQKSEQMLEKAQLVLLVFDASKPLDEEDRRLLSLTKDKLRLCLYNKSDLVKKIPEEGIAICAKEKKIQSLLNALEKLYEENVLSEKPLLSNERQIGLLHLAKEDMMRAKQAMELETEPDLIEIDIQSAHDHLKEILGEVSRDDLLDTLFSKFCLGK